MDFCSRCIVAKSSLVFDVVNEEFVDSLDLGTNGGFEVSSLVSMHLRSLFSFLSGLRKCALFVDAVDKILFSCTHFVLMECVLEIKCCWFSLVQDVDRWCCFWAHVLFFICAFPHCGVQLPLSLHFSLPGKASSSVLRKVPLTYGDWVLVHSDPIALLCWYLEYLTGCYENCRYMLRRP